MREKGIQLTLFDYFSDAEDFTLNDAKKCILGQMDVKEPSVRARIYEGINKGLFERLAKGVYTVTKRIGSNGACTCMLLNGDGRDISFIQNRAVDAIVNDSPYLMPKSHVGGNRDFTNTYECFLYKQNDFDEKYRVLKDGCFLVEFMPEENADNFEYIHQIKQMALASGFEYYARVPWKKGSFVANTGRKAKNMEDVLLFTKGKARRLRLDKKKMKADSEHEYFMSGTNGMLPTVFDVQPPNEKEKIHQAEKPIQLLETILMFITKEQDIVLDQYCGSGVTGIAALNKNRNSILIEKSEKICKLTEKRLADYSENIKRIA